MSYVVCHCSHDRDVHENARLSCSLCECTLYRPTSAEDPFKNNVQMAAIRLLGFARESQFPRTQKLGAKIEGLLGDLWKLSEEEMAIKREEEQRAIDRDKAFKALEKARAQMAAAQAELEKLGEPKPAAKPRQRKSPKYNPDSLIIVECDISGCYWQGQKRKRGVHKWAAHGIRSENA